MALHWLCTLTGDNIGEVRVGHDIPESVTVEGKTYLPFPNYQFEVYGDIILLMATGETFDMLRQVVNPTVNILVTDCPNHDVVNRMGPYSLIINEHNRYQLVRKQ